MIIQCEQCQTRFRLDDSKVTDKGVKVRCAKCKHVFVVKKEQPEAVEPQADFSALLDESVSSGNEAEAAAQPASQQSTSVAESSPESPDDSAWADNDLAAKTESFDAFSFDMPGPDKQEGNEDSFSFAADEQIPAAADDDFSTPSPEADRGFAIDQDEPRPTTADDVDFAGFDFGDVPEDLGSTAAADDKAPDLGDIAMVGSPVPPEVAGEDDFSGFDFGGDTLFGDAVAAQPAEEPSKPITFDFQMDEFADSMGIDTTAGDTKKVEQEEARSDEPFSLGEIDFGDELSSVAVQQVHPDELKPSQELLFAPLAEAQTKPAPDEEDTVTTGPAAEEIQDELPPLSIGSRRKQSSVFGWLIAVVSLLLVAVLGFFGYSTFTEDKGKGVAESGRITLRSVEASYVKNPLIGDLLVITGEAVNEYKKPRASIQIKGMVYDANGQVVVAKNAYCGNPLTKEQIAILPAEKIEAAMANQFGDSLANMEVAVGKAIPFVIVISKPPAAAKDYGVEPAGSTVATGK